MFGNNNSSVNKNSSRDQLDSKENRKTYAQQAESAPRRRKSSVAILHKTPPKFTVIPVKISKEDDSGHLHTHCIPTIRLQSEGENGRSILVQSKVNLKNRLNSEGDIDLLQIKTMHYKNRFKSEGDTDDSDHSSRFSPQIRVKSLSSSLSTEENSESNGPAGQDRGISLQPHYHTFNGVPPSLASILLPKDIRSSSNLSIAKVSSMCHFNHYGNLPHGATLSPLHQTNTLHERLLTNLLKDSQKNIEFGTTDGKNLKVYSRKTSFQLLDSGSTVLEALTGSRKERFPHSYGISEEEGRDRPVWKSKLEFILSCIGACVGLGSFWRLPYLCLLYGRAAFLVPYFVIFLIGGIPLLLAELAVGQFTQEGPIEAFKSICPLMQGVGVGLVMLSLFLSVYYSLIFSESILSLGMVLGEPHVFCNTSELLFCSRQAMASLSLSNFTHIPVNSGVEESIALMDHINPKTEAIITLLVTLIISWMLVYFALWKSVRSIGKISKISATVPFVLIFVFVWRALTLPGATTGLQYFFDPQWKVLTSGEVWINAGVQVLISLNVVFGCTVTFSSYNKHWNNVTTDVRVISAISCASSLLAVIIVFSGIGNIVHETGHHIEDINFAEADLAFVVYPRILFKMPQKHLWAAVFFLLLLLLGLDSQFSSVEVIVTSLSDKIKKSNPQMKFRILDELIMKHEALVFGVCLVCLIASLPFVLQGHEFFPHLNDFDAMNLALLTLTICEAMTFFWLYGTRRLQRCIMQMTSRRPNIYYFYCWRIFTPLSFIALLIMALVAFELPTLNREGSNMSKAYMDILSCILAVISVIPVPIFAIWSLYHVKEGSFRERLIKVLEPKIKVKIHSPGFKDQKKSFLTWLRYFSPSFTPRKISSSTLQTF